MRFFAVRSVTQPVSAASSSTTRTTSGSAVDGVVQAGDAAEPVLPAAHHRDGVLEDLGEGRLRSRRRCRSRHGANRANRRPAGGEFHAALRVHRPHRHQPGADQRGEVQQQRPDHRPLPGAGGADDEDVGADQLQPPRPAVLGQAPAAAQR